MLLFPIFLNNELIKTEAFALMGCYAPYVGTLLPTFRDSLSVPSPRVKPPKKSSWFVAVQSTRTSARVQLPVHGRYKAAEIAHRILLLNVCYFLFNFYVFVVFVYFCWRYNCTRVVEPERNLIMNEIFNYHHKKGKVIPLQARCGPEGG